MDFINVYENAISDETCDALVNQFNVSFNNDAVFRNDKEQLMREDSVLYLQEPHTNIANELHNQILNSSASYSKKYEILRGLNLKSFVVKIQKTEPSEGYHKWHCEQASIDVATRSMVWSVFLNDVDEGGEMEFLYQQKRVKPSKGSLCLFPASWTHTHRGNPPLSNTKYIATGWFNLY